MKITNHYIIQQYNLSILLVTVAVIILSPTTNGQRNRVIGQRYTVSRSNIQGQCTLMERCDEVLSNYRAGIKHTLCTKVTRGQAVVCCPTAKRISEKKCAEYLQIRHKVLRPLPLIGVSSPERAEESGITSRTSINTGSNNDDYILQDGDTNDDRGEPEYALDQNDSIAMTRFQNNHNSALRQGFSIKEEADDSGVGTNDDLSDGSDESLTYDGRRKRQVKNMQNVSNDNAARCDIVSNPLIANGRDAKLEEFPYMVALGYGKLQDKTWGYGGVLISDNFVLTAAHCIDTKYGNPKRVIVGQLQLQNTLNTSRKAYVRILQTIVHPQYKPPKKYNDIALLKLANRLKLTKHVLPVCLPQAKLKLELDKNATFQVTGWGALGAFKGQSNSLQAANMFPHPRDSCNNVFKDSSEKPRFYPQGIVRSQICAKHPKSDTCNGDSGGPLIYKKVVNGQCTDFVVGITSFGSLYCGYGIPGVYTNVQSFVNWIEENVWT